MWQRMWPGVTTKRHRARRERRWSLAAVVFDVPVLALVLVLALALGG